MPPLRAATLVAWGNATLSGRVSPDQTADAVRGCCDLPHRAVGLDEEPIDVVTTLARLRGRGVDGLRLVLPVPGDTLGLPGPAEVNAAALEAGEVAIAVGAPLALVPYVSAVDDTPEVVWRAVEVPERPNPLPSLAEADRGLSTSLREATDLLDGLDVGRLTDAQAELLTRLREGRFDGPRLPPGLPERADTVLVRARRLLAIVGVAVLDEGGAVTAAEVTARQDALLPLATAARHALAAAYSWGSEQAPEPRPVA